MEIIQTLNFFRTIYMINQSPYMLTHFIGIGQEMSSYESFDVIVNVNVDWDDIRVFRENGKVIYYIGENVDIIPELVILYQDNPHFRFLFNRMGNVGNGNKISSIAISFLVKIVGET